MRPKLYIRITNFTKIRRYELQIADKKVLLASLGGLFLIIVDQYLKNVARSEPMVAHYLIRPWLGWELFENPGIAFSIPFSNTLLVIFTPVILIGLAALLLKDGQAPFTRSLGLILIIAGALSNYIDRFLFGTTIDYLRILTSVINLADVAIIVGAGLCVMPKRLKTKNQIS